MMEQGAWLLYLKDIRRTRILDRHEEGALVERALRGDRRAREILVASNLRFVLRIALRYRNAGLPLADLVNEGCIGLLRALDSFAPDRGVRFLSYAVWWVRASMTSALDRGGSLVRVPGRLAGRGSSASYRLPPNLPRYESLDMDDSPSRILAAPPLLASGGLLDRLPPSAHAALGRSESEGESALSPFAEALVAGLPEREAQVLRGLYCLDERPSRSLRQLADSLGLSHQRIRQLRDQALRRLRLQSAAAVRDLL